MRRFLSLSLMLLAFAIGISAQKMILNAPKVVKRGEQFRTQYRVEYTGSANNASDFKLEPLPDGIEVMMGPSHSTNTSVQYVNGKTTESSSETFTYVLKATKNGAYTLPAAQVKVEGKTVISNTAQIKVSDDAPAATTGKTEERKNTAKISDNELFIKVTASKQRVRTQEPVLLTYKVYSQVNLTQLSGKMPDLRDCVVEEIPLPQQKQFEAETLNGKNYKTVTWSEYVLFPQKPGTLRVPSIAYDGIVAEKDGSVDPFDAFFNGGSGFKEVKKQLVAPGVDIVVEPLPNEPENFSGGVGTFSVSASLDNQSAIVGDTVVLHVTVSGKGNLNMIDGPRVEIPRFQGTHEVEDTENISLTKVGLTGSMVYDHILVPSASGIFKIPAIAFVYFDLFAKTYKTVKTQPFTLTVANADGTITPVADATSVADATPESATKNVDWDFLSFLVLLAILLLVAGYIVIERRRKAKP